MSPREERRFRLVWIVGLPLAGILGVVPSLNDWSVGWIYLAEITFFVAAVAFVQHVPRERSRRRR